MTSQFIISHSNPEDFCCHRAAHWHRTASCLLQSSDGPSTAATRASACHLVSYSLSRPLLPHGRSEPHAGGQRNCPRPRAPPEKAARLNNLRVRLLGLFRLLCRAALVVGGGTLRGHRAHAAGAAAGDLPPRRHPRHDREPLLAAMRARPFGQCGLAPFPGICGSTRLRSASGLIVDSDQTLAQLHQLRAASDTRGCHARWFRG